MGFERPRHSRKGGHTFSLLPALFCAAIASAQETSVQNLVPAYVGTESCIECHTSEYEDWIGSHHDLAWTEPDPETVLGEFNDTTFTHKGVTSRFTREGDTLFIESDGPDGAMTKWPVVGVIGITPLQQYFVETEPGRYQSFDVPWDTERNEWFHMYADQDLPASEAYHWTGPYKTWNNRCAECHATDYWRNYDAGRRTYSSTFSEIGVGCEACHGPGAAHLEWAKAEGDVPDWPRPGLDASGLTIDFSQSDAETEIQQCAMCHSRRGPLRYGSALPGTAFHDAYRLSTLRPGMYHPDGQILDEVYVYGSFLQSKMYAAGVQCSDCHDVHTARHYNEGNGICLSCHSPAGNPEYPTLRLADYESPEHHFHEEDTEGSQCVSCHMIERVYMGVDGRHDHTFRVPRPDLTIATGSPNACNDCHVDEGAEWAQAEIEKRFPEPTHRPPHFATTFAAAWQGDTSVADGLVEIALSNQPGIVRATALEILASYAGPADAEATAALLGDRDPMVRAHAVLVQRAAGPVEMLTRLLPLLEDEIRLVRQATVRELFSVPVAHMPERYATVLEDAMADWQQTLAATADFPEGQLALGGVALSTRDADAALRAFREAVRMDPQLVQAWSVIVRIEAAMGRMDAARTTLKQARSLNPNDYGLLQIEESLPE